VLLQTTLNAIRLSANTLTTDLPGRTSAYRVAEVRQRPQVSGPFFVWNEGICDRYSRPEFARLSIGFQVSVLNILFGATQVYCYWPARALHVLPLSAALTNGTTFPNLDSAEQLIELGYGYQATPWLTLRPNVQYIIETGAFSGQDIDNALVLGLQVKASL
jgi:hypothetical protein